MRAEYGLSQFATGARDQGVIAIVIASRGTELVSCDSSRMSDERIAHRLRWSLGAVGSFVLGAALVFVVIVIDDATRAPGAFGGGVPFGAFAAAVMLPVLGFGACLGMAVVPRSVSERGKAREFAGAMALACAGLVLLLPSALFCFSAPVGLLAWVGAALFFARARRATDLVERDVGA